VPCQLSLLRFCCSLDRTCKYCLASSTCNAHGSCTTAGACSCESFPAKRSHFSAAAGFKIEDSILDVIISQARLSILERPAQPAPRIATSTRRAYVSFSLLPIQISIPCRIHAFRQTDCLATTTCSNHGTCVVATGACESFGLPCSYAFRSPLPFVFYRQLRRQLARVSNTSSSLLIVLWWRLANLKFRVIIIAPISSSRSSWNVSQLLLTNLPAFSTTQDVDLLELHSRLLRTELHLLLRGHHLQRARESSLIDGLIDRFVQNFCVRSSCRICASSWARVWLALALFDAVCSIDFSRFCRLTFAQILGNWTDPSCFRCVLIAWQYAGHVQRERQLRLQQPVWRERDVQRLLHRL
jgi:hypothetical protein